LQWKAFDLIGGIIAVPKWNKATWFTILRNHPS